MFLVVAVATLTAQVPADSASQPDARRGVTLIAATVPRTPKVLLIFDMEGISGIDDPAMVNYGTTSYERGREALVADVNSVVDGLAAGGVTEIAVRDAHGSGVPGGQDFPSDRLDERAHLLVVGQPWWNQGHWDAVVLVGMHAGPGSGGFLPHEGTIGGGERIFNGISLTETDFHAMNAADKAGIPVIFASGDDVLHKRLAETMPWVEYVEVKKTVTVTKSAAYGPQKVRTALRDGATHALTRLSEAKIVRLNTPVQVTFRAHPPLDLRLIVGMPGLDAKEDGTGTVSVNFIAPDFDSAYRGCGRFNFLGRWIATTALATEALKGLPDYDDIVKRRGKADQLFAQAWLREEAKRASGDASPRKPLSFP
jgi:D-amino peptidase